MSPPATGWQDAYVSLAPVFGAVLKRLHRSGLVRNANEGLDVLHDFVIESLPKVAEHVDVGDAANHGYVAVAFHRFAVRQLVRERKLAWLLESDEADALAAPDSAIEHALDRKVLEASLASLPEADRSILTVYVAGERPSLRAVAAHLGISRHAAYNQVLKALAAFVAVLREHPLLSTADLQVARAAFIDEWPNETIAAKLRLSEAHVRAAKARVLRAVETALKTSGETP